MPEPAGEQQAEAPAPDSQSGDAEQRIEVNTDVLALEIDPLGGDIVRVALPEYPRHADTPDQPFVLLQNDAGRTYVAQSGLVGKNGTDTAEGRPTWQAGQDRYRLQDGEKELNVDLTLSQSGGVEIIKRYTFERGSYLVRVSHIVRNNSGEAWQGALYGQIKRDGSEDPGKSTQGFIPMPTYLGAAYWSQDKPYNKLPFDDMQDEPLRLTQEGGWIAMLQHYFVSAWIPDAQGRYTYSTLYRENRNEYLLRFVSASAEVQPGEEKVFYAEFYTGPKIQDRLEAISPGFNMTVDYGWLWFLAQPIFHLLVFLQSGELDIFGLQMDLGFGVGNWGVAIILLTLVIKSLFFKLSATSYRSMAKMRKVAPEMQRIKEQYGNDRQKMSQEMMKFYKEKGVNPFAGCWPILIQIPIFLGMFWMLRSAAELYGQGFLWAHDLSEQDSISVQQGFSLNLLPILMVATQWFQMKLNPMQMGPEMSEAQRINAKMMRFMPFMFLIFLYFFSSALVLYWTVQNLMTILQTLITKRAPLPGEEEEAEKAEPDSEQEEERPDRKELSDEERRYRNLLGLRAKGPIDGTVLEKNYKEKSQNYTSARLDSMSTGKREQALEKKERLEKAYEYLRSSLDKET